jgi:protein-L-isoaspartate(D-aspartate) O-methyltransferase
MCELAEFQGTERALEIGTGSGYAAAILSLLAKEVYTIERIGLLYERVQKYLEENGYSSVHCIQGNGYEGYPEAAPYDVILLSAAPGKIPAELLEQLKIGGRMVGPIGTMEQYLVRILRTSTGYEQSEHGAVRFVPMK